MPYKVEEQEFSWVSVAETCKCKPRGTIFAFTLYPFVKNTSLLIPCRRASVSPLCPHPVWGMFTPTLLRLHTVLVISLFFFTAEPTIPSLLWHWSSSLHGTTSDSLAGGARFSSRIWSESERQAAGRRVFFLSFFFFLITISCYFQFDNRI